MNYDPIRWCYNCQKAKPRDTFVCIPGTKRMICGDCKRIRDEVMARKEVVK